MSEFVELAKSLKRTKLTNWKRQQYWNKQFLALHSSTTHILLVTKVRLVRIIHRRNNTIYLAASFSKSFLHQIFPVVTLQRQTYNTNSPVSLQTYLCFTPLKPKIPSKCKSIPYTKDNAASPSWRPVHWWWGSKHRGVPQMHSYRCVTACTSGRWQHH